MKRRVVPFLAAGLLSACGGGGTSGPVPNAPNTSVSGAARAAVTFTLLIPPPMSPAADRRALYVSPATVSVVVTLTAQNGTLLTPAQPYALSVANLSGCHRAPTAIARAPQAARKPRSVAPQRCIFSIPAPVGLDTFTISTYDAAQASAAPATLAGHLLSTATTSTTVVANAANSVSLTLGGVVASLTLGLADASPIEGVVQTISLLVDALDADGHLIIGAGSYANPVTLANTDASGATTLSTTTITQFGTVTVAYTGAPASATFTASASGVTPVTATLVSQPEVFVANLVSGSMTTYLANGTAHAPTITGLLHPCCIAVDAAGKIYVINTDDNTLVTYTAAGTATTPTISGGTTDPGGVAVDASGKIYLSDTNANVVKTFDAAGNAATPTISDPHGPYAVAVDAAGKIYVTNAGNNTLTTYTANGSATTPTITGLNVPHGVAVDAAGKIYITNQGNNTLTTYNADGSSATPTITSGLNSPEGVAVAASGKIYVANLNANTVTIFAANGTFITPLITTGTLPFGVAVR
jgi:YVTN family beta-propeller protein